MLDGRKTDLYLNLRRVEGTLRLTIKLDSISCVNFYFRMGVEKRFPYCLSRLISLCISSITCIGSAALLIGRPTTT